MGSGASKNKHRFESPMSSRFQDNGSFISTTRQISMQTKHSQIEAQIEQDRLTEKRTLKILLLGGPDSGKSTIFRQMKILHMDGFTESDLINFRFLIHCNILQAVDQLVKGCQQLNITLGSIKGQVEQFCKFYESDPVGEHNFDDTTAQVCKAIWNSRPIQTLFKRKNEITLLESAQYFLDNIDRIAQMDYKPTNQDVLRARRATSGIHEIQFSYKHVILKMVDVGGQRSEQRKWIHCFDNVHAVLFIASAAAYDRLLEEDKTVNSLVNGIALFEGVCNNGTFRKAAIIAFINKIDVLSETISDTKPLKLCFPDYTGSNSFEEASHFIREKFINVSCGNRNVYTHFTVATDTDNVAKIFESCMYVILKDNMIKLGIM